MQIPHRELIAPAPVHERLEDVERGASSAALFGRAPDLMGLAERAPLRALWISGVDSRAAEQLARATQLTQLVIHDLRRVDLGCLAALVALRSLAIAGSPRLRSLAGLGSLTELRELILFDCCSYASIEALASLPGLETLCLEGGFSKLLRLETLEPLRTLRRLRRLRLASLRVADGSLEPLHGAGELREVFIAKTFSEAELRRLAAALPLARGEYLDSSRDDTARLPAPRLPTD